MEVLAWLIPLSVAIGASWLAVFVWTLQSRQYEDLEGDRHRILTGDHDDHPAPCKNDGSQ